VAKKGLKKHFDTEYTEGLRGKMEEKAKNPKA
jgi:hypothetical protein